MCLFQSPPAGDTLLNVCYSFSLALFWPNHFCVISYFTEQREPSITITQKGVFRTNCVDCLDRTNIVQSLLARVTVQEQLLVSFIDVSFLPSFPWGRCQDVEKLYCHLFCVVISFHGDTVDFLDHGLMKTSIQALSITENYVHWTSWIFGSCSEIRLHVRFHIVWGACQFQSCSKQK